MGELRVLNDHGDVAVAWTADDEESVVRAEEIFLRLQKEGGVMFARSRRAKADEAMLARRFDPEADEIICVRPLVGG